jgi:DNA-binding protein HU-beta
MNKTQLVDALAERIGDRRTAASAVDGLLETIVETVKAGESVSLTGFGVFESRARAARTARNPRTGDTIDVPATTVPAFRPGAGFRTAVGNSGAPAPRSTPARPTNSVAKSNGSFAADAPATKPAGKAAAEKKAKASKSAGKPAKSVKAEKPGKKGNGNKGNGKKGKGKK